TTTSSSPLPGVGVVIGRPRWRDALLETRAAPQGGRSPASLWHTRRALATGRAGRREARPAARGRGRLRRRAGVARRSGARAPRSPPAGTGRPAATGAAGAIRWAGPGGSRASAGTVASAPARSGGPGL